MPTEKTLALLRQFSYREINVDTMAGFEAGMRSVRAVAPEHLTGARWTDWQEGLDASVRYLETRRTYFSGKTRDGKKVEVVRKGWVTRGPVISQMERMGVTGDVLVTYLDASSSIRPRTVKCGI
jgi:hypothetical protein